MRNYFLEKIFEKMYDSFVKGHCTLNKIVRQKNNTKVFTDDEKEVFCKEKILIEQYNQRMWEVNGRLFDKEKVEGLKKRKAELLRRQN